MTDEQLDLDRRFADALTRLTIARDAAINDDTRSNMEFVLQVIWDLYNQWQTAIGNPRAFSPTILANYLRELANLIDDGKIDI